MKAMIEVNERLQEELLTYINTMTHAGKVVGQLTEELKALALLQSAWCDLQNTWFESKQDEEGEYKFTFNGEEYPFTMKALFPDFPDSLSTTKSNDTGGYVPKDTIIYTTNDEDLNNGRVL